MDPLIYRRDSGTNHLTSKRKKGIFGVQWAWTHTLNKGLHIPKTRTEFFWRMGAAGAMYVKRSLKIGVYSSVWLDFRGEKSPSFWLFSFFQPSAHRFALADVMLLLFLAVVRPPLLVLSSFEQSPQWFQFQFEFVFFIIFKFIIFHNDTTNILPNYVCVVFFNTNFFSKCSLWISILKRYVWPLCSK